MPADDQYDVVHDKVRIDADEPYGCKNRPDLSGGYWVMQRTYWEDGRFTMAPEFIPFRMSSKCRNFYLWNTDPRCGECTASKDYEYRDRMEVMK